MFRVYELVERILLKLPLYDLLLATTVCNHWWLIISTSPSIRARLLNDRIPLFAAFKAGSPDSEDLCNASETSPWLFRTSASNGTVIVLKTINEDIQIFVPLDLKARARCLDAGGTRGAFHVNYKIRRGWANFYDATGALVCRKTVATSPWSLPTPKSESLWGFLRKFNTEETRRYRLWIEEVCKRDDWDKLFEINEHGGYWL